jgi:tetrahydromethanopterin S-methyltransferase subunit B
MRRVELWTEDDRAPLRLDPRVISLEPYQRNRQEAARRDAYDDGVAVGFFLGLAAMALVWLILSGLLLRLMVAAVGAVFWALGVRP